MIGNEAAPIRCYAAAMDDDQIIAQRIAGKSVRDRQGGSHQCGRIIDAWAESTIERRRVAALNVEIAKINPTVAEGPPTRLGTLDVDRVAARWQRTRSADPR
jgi:hypothetical protein